MDVSHSTRSVSPTSVTTTDATRPLDEAGNLGSLKTFKNIPVRMYRGGQLLSLKLVKPIRACEGGNERLSTLQDLIEDYFPSESSVTGM